MTIRELTEYLLENRKDQEAYNELRNREGKKVTIPPTASAEEQIQIFKQIMQTQ